MYCGLVARMDGSWSRDWRPLLPPPWITVSRAISGLENHAAVLERGLGVLAVDRDAERPHRGVQPAGAGAAGRVVGQHGEAHLVVDVGRLGLVQQVDGPGVPLLAHGGDILLEHGDALGVARCRHAGRDQALLLQADGPGHRALDPGVGQLRLEPRRHHRDPRRLCLLPQRGVRLLGAALEEEGVGLQAVGLHARQHLLGDGGDLVVGPTDLGRGGHAPVLGQQVLAVEGQHGTGFLDEAVDLALVGDEGLEGRQVVIEVEHLGVEQGGVGHVLGEGHQPAVGAPEQEVKGHHPDYVPLRGLGPHQGQVLVLVLVGPAVLLDLDGDLAL